MPNECGSCNLCCKLQGIEELEKPTNRWCKHALPGRGCSIYATKPKSCTDYKCLWLSLDWPDQYKPDRTGVIFEAPAGAEDFLIMRVKPEEYALAWRRDAVMHLIGSILKQRLSVSMTDGRRSSLFRANEFLTHWALYEGEFLGNETTDGQPVEGGPELDKCVGVKRYKYQKILYRGPIK